MEFRVLGPLEVVDGERSVALGGTKQRLLLAYLLLSSNVVVSTDQLIDVLWGEEPPETATHTLHVYISQLRKILREPGDTDAELATEGRGYVLRLLADRLDLERFLTRSEAGRQALSAKRFEVAADELRGALAMWRGDPLSDLPYGVMPEHEIVRLRELRLAATEDCVDSELALGRHTELVGELAGLVAAEPLRERLRGQQMMALYRSGRHAEALQSFRDFQLLLGAEHGIGPGQALQQLERLILQQDPKLDWHPPPAPPASATEAEGPARTAPPPAVRGRFRPWLVVAAVALALITVLAIARSWQAPAAPTSVAPDAVGRVDPTSATLQASISTAGAGPGALTWADGSVWVANTLSGTVARIDPATELVIRSVPTSGAPTDIATGEGAVWVLNGLAGTLDAIDPRTNQIVANVVVPPGSGGVAVGAGFVWVTNPIETTVTKVNPETGAVVDTIRLGPLGSGSPKAIAADPDFVWVGDELSPAMWQIDPGTGDVISNPGLRGVASAIAILADGAVWVASYEQNLVSVIDPTTLQATAFKVGRGPSDLATGEGGIWIAQSIDRTASLVDPSSGEIVSTTKLGGAPQGIAVGGGSVWVSRPA